MGRSEELALWAPRRTNAHPRLHTTSPTRAHTTPTKVPTHPYIEVLSYVHTQQLAQAQAHTPTQQKEPREHSQLSAHTLTSWCTRRSTHKPPLAHSPRDRSTSSHTQTVQQVSHTSTYNERRQKKDQQPSKMDCCFRNLTDEIRRR